MDRKRARLDPTGAALFSADVKSIKAAIAKPEDCPIKSFRAEEGSITCRVWCQSSSANCSISLFVANVEKYGIDNIAVWPEDELSDELTNQIEKIGDNRNLLIPALQQLVRVLAGQAAEQNFTKLLTPSQNGSVPNAITISDDDSDEKGKPINISTDDEDEEMEDNEDQFDFDDNEVASIILPSSATIPKEASKALRRDLKQLVDSGYHPGHTILTDGSIVVSVSIPVAETGVSVRALHAWDTKLLEEGQRLVMLLKLSNGYPSSIIQLLSTGLHFKIGLSNKSKPSKEAIITAFRMHGAVSNYTPGEFEHFALSDPLAACMDKTFPEIYKYKLQVGDRGWPSAALHVLATLSGSETPSKHMMDELDISEMDLAQSLPDDPFPSRSKENCPANAFYYLLRRFVLSARYCLICYREVENVAIKPFVCENPLCFYQYMHLGFGPSIEFELVHNEAAVDLLIQFAYVSALEQELKDGPPPGMGIKISQSAMDAITRMPAPGTNPLQYNVQAPVFIPPVVSAGPPKPWVTPADEVLYDDLLTQEAKNRAVVALINQIPKVTTMREWLEDSPTLDEQLKGKVRKLTDVANNSVNPSCWPVLRWIIASNRSYLREITHADLPVQGIPDTYRQFRFISGSPDKEATLAREVELAQRHDANARIYPLLQAFHGSGMKNWHSILRQGLHFQKTTNGRAYGHGVYFALEGDVSMGTYAAGSSNSWRNASFPCSKVTAICEILNQPAKFISRNPYLVVDQVQWIQTRYLIVPRIVAPATAAVADAFNNNRALGPTVSADNFQVSDPKYPLVLNKIPVQIPNLTTKLEKEFKRMSKKKRHNAIQLSQSDDELLAEDEEDLKAQIAEENRIAREKYKPLAPGKLALIRTLPPPTSANVMALKRLQSEVKSIMDAQMESTPEKLGFYFSPDTTNDNLFHWVVEMVGWDPKELPIAKDMKDKKVPGLLFEILFPDTFPFSPPFFRIIWPRFLPFIQGGGGHVTGGGSICMSLLTASDWNSSYSIEAILLQIRLAISNLEPRPARLASNWDTPYGVHEAIEGFRRAASTHGWRVPPEMEGLAQGRFK